MEILLQALLHDFLNIFMCYRVCSKQAFLCFPRFYFKTQIFLLLHQYRFFSFFFYFSVLQ